MKKVAPTSSTALILGPTGVVVQDQVFSQEKGESIDIVPTIANILGFVENIIKGSLKCFPLY